MKSPTYWFWVLVVRMSLAGVVGATAGWLLGGCSVFQGAKPAATADVVGEACQFAPALAQSTALQLEAERLGIPVETLVELVCASAELYDEYLRARDLRMVDPGVAVIVRLRSSR